MNAPVAASGPGGPAARLGFVPGQVVQEFGYDDDVDAGLREAIMDTVGGDLEYDDFTGVADAVILWWRDGDGDLADALVDGLTNLADGASIVLLTPKQGRAGEVDAAEIEEAALTSGLHPTGTLAVANDWSPTRLVPPKSARR